MPKARLMKNSDFSKSNNFSVNKPTEKKVTSTNSKPPERSGQQTSKNKDEQINKEEKVTSTNSEPSQQSG